MHTMPAARPSRPSTKFTALMVITTSADRQQRALPRRQRDRADTGDRHPQDRQTLHDHHTGGDHLAAQLDQGVDLQLVVEDADHPDQRGAGQQRPRLVGQLEDAVQVLQVVGDQQARAQAAEHGDAAEPRCRFSVYVTCADLRHRAGRDGELPHRTGQQVGHGGGDAERQQVITHGLAPHGNRRVGRTSHSAPTPYGGRLVRGRTRGRRAHGLHESGLADGADGCGAAVATRGAFGGYGGSRPPARRPAYRRRRSRRAAAIRAAISCHLRLAHALVVTAAVPTRMPEPSERPARRTAARRCPGRARRRPAAPVPRARRRRAGAGSAVIRWVSVPPVQRPQPLAGQPVGQRAGVGHHLVRVGGERRRRGLAERDRLRGDGVHLRRRPG